MKCPASYCVDGVLGILRDGTPVLCGYCAGEGVEFTLPRGGLYVEAALDSEGAGGHGAHVPVAEAIR